MQEIGNQSWQNFVMTQNCASPKCFVVYDDCCKVWNLILTSPGTRFIVTVLCGIFTIVKLFVNLHIFGSVYTVGCFYTHVKVVLDLRTDHMSALIDLWPAAKYFSYGSYPG